MTPTKEQDLLYFIIEGDERRSVFDLDIDGKINLLNHIKDKGDQTIIELFNPEITHFYEKEKIMQSMRLCANRIRVYSKIICIEKVIQKTKYQNSVEFTIGSSSKTKVRDKYMVTVNVDMKNALKQCNSNSMIEKGIKINPADFSITAISSVINIIGEPSAYSTYSNFNFEINTKFLGQSNNHLDVENFSYDEYFKYYTLICN